MAMWYVMTIEKEIEFYAGSYEQDVDELLEDYPECEKPTRYKLKITLEKIE